MSRGRGKSANKSPASRGSSSMRMPARTINQIEQERKAARQDLRIVQSELRKNTDAQLGGPLVNEVAIRSQRVKDLEKEATKLVTKLSVKAAANASEIYLKTPVAWRSFSSGAGKVSHILKLDWMNGISPEIQCTQNGSQSSVQVCLRYTAPAQSQQRRVMDKFETFDTLVDWAKLEQQTLDLMQVELKAIIAKAKKV